MADAEIKLLIKQATCKEFAKTQDCSLGMEACKVLSLKMEEMIKVASDRAKANKRKVIKAQDL